MLTAVGFGDRPRVVIATMALEKTALMKNCTSRGYRSLTEIPMLMTSYKAVIVNKARQLMHDMNLVLNKGAFKIRHWIMSGNNVIDEAPELLSTDGKVLGLNWNPRED